jgi:tetratricopeptide (TPR) repeat protein
MGLFFFTTFYCALRAARGGRALAWSLAASVACLLGALSKGVIVSCPLLVVLFDRCFLYASLREALRRRWPLYLGLAASWALVFALMSAYPRPATVGLHLYVADWKVGAWGWALNQCEMITTYLRLAFWPSPLIADYGMPRPLTLAQVGWEAGLLVALLLATLLLLRYRKALGFLAACWFVVLAPTSSFIPITSEVGAERRVYVPLAALVVLVVLLVRAVGTRLLPDPRRARLAGGLLALVVVLVLASLSARRNRDYHSAVAIWESVVAAAGDNGRAQLNYALALDGAGRDEEAIEHYEEALRLRTSPLPAPERAKALFNLGILHEEGGRPEEALRCYREAARLWPGLTRAVFRTGTALKALGRIEPAIHSFRLFLTREPGHPEGLLQLALCQEIQGDRAGALETCEQLVRLPGAPAQAHDLLRRLRQ